MERLVESALARPVHLFTVAMLRVAEGSLSERQLVRWLDQHTMAE